MIRFSRISIKLIFALVLAAAGILIGAQPALADGIVIPDPPPFPEPEYWQESWLSIRYHRVEVQIRNQIATTRVEQEFFNPQDWEVEGSYVFPIPEGATLSEFVLWVDGQPIEARVLPAGEARQIYEDIVRQQQDPALLEYIGRGAVMARIYPVPPGGSRKIELEYTQVLEMDQGMVRYLYPLSTEKFSPQNLEQCSIRISLETDQALRSVYSPSHQDKIFIQREGENQVLVGYEEYDVLPDQDFELIYTHSKDEIGLNLLTYSVPGFWEGEGESGYFLLLAAPGWEAETVLPRDILLVLDTSGSMEGQKMEQAKEAASYVLTHLNPEDRFNVIAFSTGVRRFAAELQPPSRAGEARAWIASMPALGGTNINQALLEALALRSWEDPDSQRPLVVLFLTDGLPTEGMTEVSQILTNVRASAPDSLRLFAFGVGDDVNTELLDTLAGDNRGLVRYVRPGESIEEEVSSLYASIQAPVLTDLELDFGSILVDEIYPPVLPDLYAGSQLLVAGRYRIPAGTSSRARIQLSGQSNNKSQEFRLQADFSPSGTEVNDFIPRLWAARKIGYLLNQIRYQGENQEWVDAVIQLSIRYGIITPYTSFLVEEEMVFSPESRDEAARELEEGYAGEAVGAEAVGKADMESNLQAADSVPEPPTFAGDSIGSQAAAAPKYIAGKTFYLQAGTWIDSQFDPAAMEPIQIGFGSGAYFELLEARPELGVYLALGQSVIVVVDGEALEIIPGENGVTDFPEGLLESPPSDPVEIGPASVVPGALRSLCSLPVVVGLAVINKGRSPLKGLRP